MTDRTGLSMKEVWEREKKYGKNVIMVKRRRRICMHVKHICSEPIYLLLAISASIYFILGDMMDGIVMISFVIFVIGIDLFQDIRTGNVLKKLKDITSPKVAVIREGKKQFILPEDLVPGDLVLLFEGVRIPADGYLLVCNELCVDESILTGESIPVMKEVRSLRINEMPPDYRRNDYCYSGTLVCRGNGQMIVECTGNATEYGKIAEKLTGIERESSLLQKQLGKLAKQCTYFAFALFVMVGIVTFLNLSDYRISERLIHSLLAGVVLALSMVPGEFPVILSVYFSMGALRLAKKKALLRRMSSVETLGAISVLCMDKTGTITQNSLRVEGAHIPEVNGEKFCKVLSLACQRDTKDAVEKALLEYGELMCSRCNDRSEEELIPCSLGEHGYQIRKEYPFTNERKAMGQLWQIGGRSILAVKGSPEAILDRSNLNEKERRSEEFRLAEYTKKGCKVIAVGDAELKGEEDAPEELSDIQLSFRGMLALADPPRAAISDSLTTCYEAGIRIIMITGDHPLTAVSIAEQVGIRNSKKVISGEEIEAASDIELMEMVRECNIYARVMPLHKMRIVKALQELGEVVAMTGDGVNDSTALKIADIGIAMGKNGSEISREAADLILLDDNFNTIMDTIRDGRRIYHNIQKTIAYVLAFHIPIALISLIAPLLGFGPEELLLMPLHIVLLELVMNPTVSVSLERQPSEPNIMSRAPRGRTQELINSRTFLKSLFQGFMIFLASFLLYYSMLIQGYTAATARTCGFVVLVISSMLLVLINCSETETIITIIRRLRKEKLIWLVNLVIVIGLLAAIYTPLHLSFGFSSLSLSDMLISITLSFAAVIWYDIVKIFRRLTKEM
jgi:P-type Ca2+ transporter type 2C